MRVGHVRPKDLRDSFASHLLTAGVQLGYISRQLGHADVGVTARHYARWCGDDGYREPLRWCRARCRPICSLGWSTHISHISSERGGAQPREFNGGPPGTRTRNQRVKSPLLYQLS